MRQYNINLIVAVADNMAIGKDNRLLWHISEDLRYFKKTTKGKCVIMGRRTYQSIGKALPDRRNIVVSKTLCQIDDAEVFSNIDMAIDAAKDDNIFIIGGGEIYRQTMPIANRLYITRVHLLVEEADTFFPEIDYSEWREVFKESYPRGERFPHPFDFIVLERIWKH